MPGTYLTSKDPDDLETNTANYAGMMSLDIVAFSLFLERLRCFVNVQTYLYRMYINMISTVHCAQEVDI